MNWTKAAKTFGLAMAALTVLGGLLTAILSARMTHWIMQTQVTLGPNSPSEVGYYFFLDVLFKAK